MPEHETGPASDAAKDGNRERVPETRFAVVLNGGVSLAVWMGGVTHELNRIRLASAQDDPEVSTDYRPEDPREAAVHDAWKAILERASRRAVVDTVAGTSAGGLNGTLLAAAVAGGKDLSDMRDVWSDVAALERTKLLSATGEPPNAVLDGQFFLEEVVDLLDDLHGDAPAVGPRDCTLLVTATALNPDPVEIELEHNARGQMMDSRRVYRFERRTRVEGPIVGEGTVTDDDFDIARPSIALASRASASFPVAFAPVLETPELRRFRVSPTTGQYESSEPERSARPEVPPRQEWLIDGGVLDNAPFGPLMKALRERAVGEPFERVILYVTPSPGVKGRARDLGDPPKARRVLKRVASALREPDLRLDYEELTHAFTQMGFTLSTPYDAVLQLLCAPVPQEFAEDVQATVARSEWFRTYQITRAEAVDRYLTALDGRIRFVKPERSSRQVRSMGSVPTARQYSGQDWQWGLATAVRALRWWGRALVAYHGEPNAPTPAIDDALVQVQRSQRKLAQLQKDLEKALREPPLPNALQDRVTLLDEALNDIKDDIQEAVDAAAARIAAIRPQEIGPRTLVDFTLAVEIASAVLSWGSGSEGDEPSFQYLQITPAAEPPLVDLGDEVTRHPEWLNRKLYGERLGHFGAFLNRDDRTADWLWGRLDGAGALCNHFLEGVDGAETLRDALTDAILAAENSSRSELRAAAAEALEISSWRLLLDLEPGTLPQSARFLWDKAGAVVRQMVHGADGQGSSGTTQAP